MKVIVLGTNHAGTTAVRTLKRLNPEIEVTTYDRNDVISFLGCGIALWVKGEVKDPNGLFYATPEILESEGINVKMKHEWVSIDADKKTVLIKNLETGETFEDNYDKVIVATGTWPLLPPIPGLDLKGVQICKNYDHAKKIQQANLDDSIKKVTVVGAGYIGVELVDAFVAHGKEVTLVDFADRIMPVYYDAEFTKHVEDRMEKAGVKLALGQGVKEFKGVDGKVTHVVTDKEEIATDYVIFSVGVVAQTKQLEGVVDLNDRKAILTNEYCQSSNPDIYAIGDCSTVFNKALNMEMPIQLATTAVRTGILAAANIVNGNKLASPGFTGANGIEVFGFKMASAGVSETSAKKMGLDYEAILLSDSDRPEFMSTYKEAWIKLVWDKKTRKIIGAQVASENNHTEIMYMLSLGIQKELTIDELPLVDIFFLPHFNKPYNFVTLAGLEVLGLNYFKK
ncbi:FAD-dependent oxidoreductase [Mesoplasma coleopterae]|uniref:NADH oxidase n=1 Tax=Mesoplasma coleopterae TaxID=324078 RepID=A0A2K8P4B3_9MOLU|nr:FAD-dependent oxidoreductase [Mesoplasma coleopterae]ATZ20563.1 NADH oxidase [Mesoplasma coleopterae]AVN62084.1 NADH oxidase [Mesoplasma coleopterae]AVN62749.1 NADH oxidase [Mesoplasma coleopterae]